MVLWTQMQSTVSSKIRAARHHDLVFCRKPRDMIHLLHPQLVGFQHFLMCFVGQLIRNSFPVRPYLPQQRCPHQQNHMLPGSGCRCPILHDHSSRGLKWNIPTSKTDPSHLDPGSSIARSGFIRALTHLNILGEHIVAHPSATAYLRSGRALLASALLNRSWSSPSCHPWRAGRYPDSDCFILESRFKVGHLL